MNPLIQIEITYDEKYGIRTHPQGMVCFSIKDGGYQWLSKQQMFELISYLVKTYNSMS